LTIPGLKNLSLSGTALIGAPAKTRLQAEYRICCCAWNDSLPVAEGEEPPADDEDPIEQGDLKCGEKIVNLSCTVTGDIATLPMTIKAREQDCPFFDHMSKKKGVNEKFPGKPGQEVTRPK
jgi:hypothetical protein